MTINHFVKSLLEKENLKIYDPKTSRPYCHVLDFARAIKTVFESKVEKIDREIFMWETIKIIFQNKNCRTNL